MAGRQKVYKGPTTIGGPMPKGLIDAGNIDLDRRAVFKDSQGRISTERSGTFKDTDGKWVLIPTVEHGGGSILKGDAAVEQYRRTKKHLGKFASEEAANAYSETLHQRQERMYSDKPRARQ